MIFLEYKYKKTEFNDISNTLGDVKDSVDSGEPSGVNYYHLREFLQVTFSAK